MNFSFLRRGLGLSALLLGLGASGTQAATFQVTSTADAGVGSLRQALADAKAAPGADTITFALPPGPQVIELTTADSDFSGDLSAFFLSHEVTIIGPGANLLTVRRSLAAGTPAFRLFRVVSKVSISGITLSNGLCSVNPSTGASYNGGAFFNYNASNLSLTNCVISGNSSASLEASSGGIGGGIYNSGANLPNINTGILNISGCSFVGNKAARWGGGLANSGGTVILTGSTFTQNQIYSDGSAQGGGLFNSGGSLTISNSTFSGNSAISTGTTGGPVLGGGLFLANGTATLDSCTVTGNVTSGLGGGICGANATVTLNNSIVAGNTATGSGPDIHGAMSSDYNLVQNPSGATLSGVHDLTGIDPKLGPLQDNGGPTLTHALLPGSPARDCGQTALTTDQRGILRPQGGVADRGAVETDATKPSIAFSTPANNSSLAISAFGVGTVTGTAGDNLGVTGVRVTLSRARSGRAGIEYWNGSAFTFTPTTIAATLSGSGGLVKWNLGALTPPTAQLDEGAYRVDAYALDAQGLRSASAQLTFTLVQVTSDGTLPVISLSSPTLNQKILLSGFNSSSISGAASDNIGVSSVKVRLSRKRGNTNYYWNGIEFGTTPSTVEADLTGVASASWALGSKRPAAAQLDSGLYQVEVQAVDLVGNKSAWVKTTFTLGTDFTPPIVSISSPTANQKFLISPTQDIPINGVASDNMGVVSVAVRLTYKRDNITYYWNGGGFGTNSETAITQVLPAGGKSVTWRSVPLTTQGMQPGTYTVYAIAYDAVGNSATTAGRSFTVGFATSTATLAAPSGGGS